MRLRAFLCSGILLACLSVTFSASVYKEILAARRIWESTKDFEASVYGAPLMKNGRAILRELDIVEPIPCVIATGGADLQKTFDLQASPVRMCQEDELTTRSKRNIKLDRHARRWPSRQIPYELNRNLFSAIELANIDAAFAEYERYTCIKFVPSNQKIPRLRIVRGAGCHSWIGQQYAVQDVSLGLECADSKATPIHELFHALGSEHQHNRPDRDQYIQVNLNNAFGNMTHNFDIAQNGLTYGIPYNFRSVMHYETWAFSKNGLPTMLPRPRYQGATLGDAPTFSYEDLKLINRYFNCDNACWFWQVCWGNSYRDKDCNCNCKSRRGLDPPVRKCSRFGNSPTRLNQQSATLCTEDKCKNNTGTVCDKDTGACIPISECEALGKKCICSVQGSDACKRIPGSQCDENSNACVCLPHMTPNSDRTSCVAENHPLFINDGSSISPLISDFVQNKQFSVVETSEPASTLGINRNARALHVNGTMDTEQAVLIVPPLTDDDSLEGIKLCVDYSENNLDAVLYVRSRASPTSSWQEFGFPPQNDLKAGGSLRKLTFKVPRASTFEVQMKARPYKLGFNNYWEVNLDPILIYRCD